MRKRKRTQGIKSKLEQKSIDTSNLTTRLKQELWSTLYKRLGWPLFVQVMVKIRHSIFDKNDVK